MSDKSDELKAQITEGTQALMDKIAAGPSESYQEFMRFAARFHRYSYGNMSLIYKQRPNATYVASFDAWLKKHKNPVAKGEKGIKILVPYHFKKTDAEGNERHGLTFGQGTVFDVSQTANPDFAPEFFTGLGDDKSELYAIVLGVMNNTGIDTQETDIPHGGAEGWSTGGSVRIMSDRPVNNKLATVIHEWAHELNHWGENRNKYTNHQMECHAESITFIVCQALGLDVSYSADYVINHSNTVETFKAEMDIITKGAKAILEQIEEAMKPQKSEAVA